MYIIGAPTVESKSRDVYHWCAYCRIRVQDCILLVRPPWKTSLEMHISGAPVGG